nr:variable surface lipoprotein [Mycoplasmopsis bovis]
MKKSKFLLLGSVASLASIPFVASLNVVKPKKKKRSLKHLKENPKEKAPKETRNT